MKFTCQFAGDSIYVHEPYFDTLQFFISRSNPDLISFKESNFSRKCTDHIESIGYRFMPLNIAQDSTLQLVSPVAYKISSFDFLASSVISYNNDSLRYGQNLVSWYQLRNQRTGHIFYLFNLQLQKNLTLYQSRLIGFDLLRKIDEISAGVPVILIGDFYGSNAEIKRLLTDNWKNTYPLSEVKTSHQESDFLVNEFLKIKNSSSNKTNDSIINSVVIQFAINTKKISRSKSGHPIPEY